MLVSRGDRVELWFNDWQHPPEQLPVVAGERHTYRFTQIPRDIRLVRFDPTDLPECADCHLQSPGENRRSRSNGNSDPPI